MQKTMTLLILLISCATLSWSQNNDTTAIQNRLNDYFEATASKDWNKVVDMVYPKLFDLVKKEDMVQLFADMEGNGMAFQMKGFKVNSISPTVIHEGEHFALVDYDAKMNIRFTSEAYQEESMISTLRGSFEATYGKDNVAYQEEDNSFDILAEKTMFAIAPEGSTEWSFIENNPGQEGMLGALIPAAVREKLAADK